MKRFVIKVNDGTDRYVAKGGREIIYMPKPEDVVRWARRFKTRKAATDSAELETFPYTIEEIEVEK